VFQHTLSLGQSFFDRTPTGRLLTRATSDVEALGETLTAGAITIVLDVLQVVGVVTAMLWLDARLTATLLLVAPPLALIVELLRKRLRALFGLIRDAQAALNAYLSERLDGLEVVQLHRDEARTQAAFRARLHRYRDAAVRTNIYDALMYATVDGLTSVTMALLLAYGAFAAEGTLTAGLMAAFIEYVARLFRPIQEFSGKVAVIQRAGAALVKLFGLLDVEERVQGGTAQLGDVRGELVLEDVSFAYGDGPDVLHGRPAAVRRLLRLPRQHPPRRPRAVRPLARCRARRGGHRAAGRPALSGRRALQPQPRPRPVR
jgi:ATP-binding cassette subfamily B multidrug efflux pump